MQELIEKINDAQRQIISESEYANGYDGALSDFTNIAESLLKKEREQIINCALETTQNCWKSLAEELKIPEINFTEEDLKNQRNESEQYYNETFN